MQLHVTMTGGSPDMDPLELTVESFDDLDKIAARVGRQVKSFLRTVPVRKAPSRARFDVTASYTEAQDNGAPHVDVDGNGTTKPKRRRKRAR